MTALTSCPLSGSIIDLLPLEPSHATALWQAGTDPSLWLLQPRLIASEADMCSYVQTALSDAASSAALPYVVWHRARKAIIGSSRFFDISQEHQRAEIGATWYSPEFHRTGVNLEAKLLLLTHAFESCHFNKIIFKTELLNTASRRAIEALGAVQEGVFEQHSRTASGRWRDMVYYRIFRADWQECKQRMMLRLARYAAEVSA
jgi:N-acetyltransferase